MSREKLTPQPPQGTTIKVDEYGMVAYANGLVWGSYAIPGKYEYENGIWYVTRKKEQLMEAPCYLCNDLGYTFTANGTPYRCSECLRLGIDAPSISKLLIDFGQMIMKHKMLIHRLEELIVPAANILNKE
jgi:hypothetical protein